MLERFLAVDGDVDAVALVGEDRAEPVRDRPLVVGDQDLRWLLRGHSCLGSTAARCAGKSDVTSGRLRLEPNVDRPTSAVTRWPDEAGGEPSPIARNMDTNRALLVAASRRAVTRQRRSRTRRAATSIPVAPVGEVRCRRVAAFGPRRAASYIAITGPRERSRGRSWPGAPGRATRRSAGSPIQLAPRPRRERRGPPRLHVARSQRERTTSRFTDTPFSAFLISCATGPPDCCSARSQSSVDDASPAPSLAGSASSGVPRRPRADGRARRHADAARPA